MPCSSARAQARPLSLYWFGKDDAARDAVLSRTVSGGVTVNDRLFHYLQVNQPMGRRRRIGHRRLSRRMGFSRLHQRARRAPPLDPARSRRALPALQRERTPARPDLAAELASSDLSLPGLTGQSSNHRALSIWS